MANTILKRSRASHLYDPPGEVYEPEAALYDIVDRELQVLGIVLAYELGHPIYDRVAEAMWDLPDSLSRREPRRRAMVLTLELREELCDIVRVDQLNPEQARAVVEVTRNVLEREGLLCDQPEEENRLTQLLADFSPNELFSIKEAFFRWYRYLD